jgi:hypothetical protein
MCSLCTLQVYVTVTNKKKWNCSLKTQQCVPSISLSQVTNNNTYKTAEFCHGNATMNVLTIVVQLHVSHCRQQYKRTLVSMCSFWKQISTFMTDFNKGLHYEISRKSIHYEPSWYTRTDGRTGGQRQTDRHMTKLKCTFRDYANVHINGFVYSTEIQKTQAVHYIHYWGYEYDGLIAWMGYHLAN